MNTHLLCTHSPSLERRAVLLSQDPPLSTAPWQELSAQTPTLRWQSSPALSSLGDLLFMSEVNDHLYTLKAMHVFLIRVLQNLRVCLGVFLNSWGYSVLMGG